VKRFWWTWSLLNLAGIAILAIEETDAPVIRFSADHGPGPLDMVGLAPILIAAGMMFYQLSRRFGAIRSALARRPATAGWLLFALGTGTGLTVASIFSDFWWWWAIGIGILAALQILFVAMGAEPA
jgi:hypothetical protein